MKINKSSHFNGQTAGLEKVETTIMGALPHTIFWCFTGKGKSQVQRMVLCFLLFHTESAFPSKEMLTKENKGKDYFILYQHKMCSIVLIEAICFRGWSSVEIK